MRTWLREWFVHLLPHAPTRGLRVLYRHLRADSGRVIRGRFNDPGGSGCLVEWLGRAHPECRNLEHPGCAFLDLAGLTDGSSFVEEWDKNPAFRGELLTILRDELRLRRDYRNARPFRSRKERARCCS